MSLKQLNNIHNTAVEEIGDLVSVLTSIQKTTDNFMDKQSAQVMRKVPVPTSEHVAQIVGKNGSKIKFLRTETNTCIKTPYRGDDPVFVVTGQLENVRIAAMAIEKASQHFTQLIESRDNKCTDGEITILVDVPKKYVGVVVGRHGSVIMGIKDQTNTRINTPKGNAHNPVFEVTGTPMNVMAAEEAIRDRVNQIQYLRSSCKFDPTLNQLIQTQRPSMPSRPSPMHSLDISLSSHQNILSSMANRPITPPVFDPIFNYIQTNQNSIH